MRKPVLAGSLAGCLLLVPCAGAAAALIGKLQAGMQLGYLHFSVSPEARRAVENELIAQAIGAFIKTAQTANSLYFAR